MADLVMRKRPAMHAGELGLFIDSPVFEDDFAEIRQGVDLQAEVTQPHNLKQFRLAWALAAKIAKSGTLGDADTRETMDYLLRKCRHVRYIHNKHRDGQEMEIVVKSIRWTRLEPEAFTRLFNRMIYIITTEILPDVPEGVIRDEIEKMAGVTTPEPAEKATPKRRRPPAATPAPVPVIPPVDEAGPADAASPAPKPPRASAPEPAPSASPAAQAGGAGPVTAPAPIVVARPDPTNVQTWKDYCKAWLDEVHTDTELSDVAVLAKWNGEQKLRNRCGVTAEDRQGHFAYMTAIVEEKRERQAKKVQP